jgi:adenylosuccinate synthase
LTKLDVLTGLKEIKICVAYQLDGKEITDDPLHGLDRVTPVYKTMPGWTEDITGAKSIDVLPENARLYIDEISRLTGAPILLVSVGPDRDHTILLKDLYAK